MARSSRWGKLESLLRAEMHQLMTINASDRLWQMPFAAALASGLPLLVGAYFDRVDYGLVSSLAGWCSCPCPTRRFLIAWVP